MAFINELIVFDTPTDISNIPLAKLSDGMFYSCRDTGSGFPGWYEYKAGSSETLTSPTIIDSNYGAGQFVLFGGSTSGSGSVILTVSTSDPTASPPSVTPETGGQVCLHLEMNFVGSSSVFKTWIGIDSTGVEGNNGWYYNEGWYF